MNYNNFDVRLSRGTFSDKKCSKLAGRAKKRVGKREEKRGAMTRRAAVLSKRMTAAACAMALTICSAAAQSYVVDLDAPSMDKWVYPFTGNGGGTRASGPTFGAIGSEGFDDRDAQFFARFDTSSIVPTGLGADSYQIVSAKFTLSLAVGDAVVFDGTYDPISTYGPNGEPINGDDPGRPMELYGAAYRNGFTPGAITETTPFGGSSEGTRNIHPTDFLLGGSLSGANRDVSNNVSSGFDPNPFAIGQIAPSDLSGGVALADADVVFTLNLSNADVLRYLQLSLDEGQVSFVATSLHEASQGGPLIYPDFYTKENLLLGQPGRLDLEVQVVPEPGVAGLILAAGALFGMGRRGRISRV